MELRHYASILQRRRWLVLSSVVLFVVLAAGFSLTQRPAYHGLAMVLVTQQDAGISILGYSQPQISYQPDREVQTQVEVVQSRLIAQRAADAIGNGVDAEYMLTQVKASSDTNTNVITIEARDSSPEGAARIANAFAQEYVRWSRDSQRASIKAAADDVERRVSQAQAQVESLESEAAAKGAGEAEQVRLETARSLYAMFSEKLEELRIAEQLATGRASVLASATVDADPVAPQPIRNTALGLAIGLFMGLSAAFLAEELDSRVKSAEDAGAIYGAPVLATIPEERLSRDGRDGLTLEVRPESPTAEAYRMLRNNLSFLDQDRKIKSVLVSSAVQGEGKSTVAANLAAVLSQTGETVTLVICDFRLQAADRYFHIEPSVGLADVLAGDAPLSAALQRPAGFPGLQVLSAGTMPGYPSEILGSAAMGRLMLELRGLSDWVILDSAPVLATADAAAAARWVDGLLLVVRLGLSRRESMRSCAEQVHNVGVRTVGIAVRGPADEVAGQGYYGYPMQ